MNLNELLGSRECSCGRKHSCDMKHILIGPRVLAQINTLLDDYQSILLVADKNTYAVCGELVKAQSGDKLAGEVIFTGEGLLIPDEAAVAEVEKHMTDRIDLIIGVGSGVIQDLCKYVSFQAGLPYYIVATAPSMDGYASKGAAMIMNHMKVTYNAHVPEAIIADSDILKDAPMEMIQSGYGDILGKFSCLNDWKLSRVVNDEYFCQYVYDLTYEMLTKTKDLGEKLLKRDAEAMTTLMEALVGVGIAMAYVGNSRPASGSEHHLSHFFEITGILEDKPYFMHGTDVVYSAVYTQRLREELLKLKTPTEHETEDTGAAKETWETNIRRVYGVAADGVIELQEKMGWYKMDRLPIYRAKWEEIKEVLQEAPSSETLTAYVNSVGLDIDEYEKLYGAEKIQDALLYAKDLKDRYSVLWMWYEINRGESDV